MATDPYKILSDLIAAHFVAFKEFSGFYIENCFSMLNRINGCHRYHVMYNSKDGSYYRNTVSGNIKSIHIKMHYSNVNIIFRRSQNTAKSLFPI